MVGVSVRWLTVILDGKNFCFAAATRVSKAENCSTHEKA